MTSIFVLVGFGLIVFSPCVVALNSSLGDDQSPLATFVLSCRTKLRRIL